MGANAVAMARETGAARRLAAWRRREPAFAGAALVLAALVPPTALAMALDPRMPGGASVWLKPLKFEIALAVYFATLAWFAGWLPAATTRRRWHRVFAVAVVAGAAAEMAWIGGAAAFGVASHFNVATPVMARMYGLMGVVAVALTSSALVYGVLFLRDRGSALAPALRLSLGLGLVLTFVLTVITAGTMASGMSAVVGGTGAGADTLPLFGWARDRGDLRVAHFLATHAMHAVPAFGFAASRLLTAGAARAAVIAFAALYAGLVVAAFAQALAGRPFIAAAAV